MVMLGEACTPSTTCSVPYLMIAWYWPALSPSPERLNWMTEFIPLAASALKRFGISAKISFTVGIALLLLLVLVFRRDGIAAGRTLATTPGRPTGCAHAPGRRS